ncbi:hemerythrin-like domain-containing protein [Sphaerotilus hippei]|uniref:Hemerythrin-like domain-containing protein n=1 Tax=Sphaerotilus hippei TaxID=744406 RepID=A0A318H3I6_9BURK|nr:hemerythrin domain-containing protein [Sphaerotilus hippei]PXW98107.1 hemerythrin-like domain-containing protein [Sphaerotilus hippei]
MTQIQNDVVASPLAPIDLMVAPFQALDECHRQIAQALDRLGHFIEHLDDHGVDEQSRRHAGELVEFFTRTARAHHADEERLVFPDLLVSEDVHLVQQVRRLQQDHGWLEEDWIELSPQLDAISQGYSWYDIDALRHGAAIFTALYQDHIDLEESLVYPEARRRMAERPDVGQGRAQAQMRRQSGN